MKFMKLAKDLYHKLSSYEMATHVRCPVYAMPVGCRDSVFMSSIRFFFYAIQ